MHIISSLVALGIGSVVYTAWSLFIMSLTVRDSHLPMVFMHVQSVDIRAGYRYYGKY